MQIRRVTIEHALYALAFSLALGLRLLALGSTPLNEVEAGWSLQALAISKGEQAAIGPQPGYVIVTGFLISLVGSSNGIARFWPALSGSLLVWLPFFLLPAFETTFKLRSGGRIAALLLTYGLAIDPALVSLSRQAGGPMPALSYGLLALGALVAMHPVLGGVFAGLALLSGDFLFPGLLSLSLSLLVGYRLSERPGSLKAAFFPGLKSFEAGDLTPSSRRHLTGTFGLAAMSVILVAGTAFFRYPQGLAATLGGLLAYLAGWGADPLVPALRLPASILIYQPLIVLLGLAGIARSWLRAQDEGEGLLLSRILSLAFVFALALAMIYPARQVTHAAWPLVFLWSLAALELVRYLPIDWQERWRIVSYGHALLFLVLLVFVGLTLTMLGRNQAGSELANQQNLTFMRVIVGAVLMGALTTLLVALGWSWEVARRGMVWGLTAGLVLYMLSGWWALSYQPPGVSQELWRANPEPGEADLLLNTLGDLSEWNTGRRDALDVTVTSTADSLRWLLREQTEVRYTSPRGMKGQPSVIISGADQEIPGLPAAYRGQDFIWSVRPAWQGVLPPGFPGWLTTRAAPMQSERVILWARADLLPAGSSSAMLPPDGSDVEP